MQVPEQHSELEVHELPEPPHEAQAWLWQLYPAQQSEFEPHPAPLLPQAHCPEELQVPEAQSLPVLQGVPCPPRHELPLQIFEQQSEGLEQVLLVPLQVSQVPPVPQTNPLQQGEAEPHVPPAETQVAWQVLVSGEQLPEQQSALLEQVA